MGTYCYKISRKSRKVRGLPNLQDRVYLAEFAYKLGGYDDVEAQRKTVAPTRRAWEKFFTKNYPMDIRNVYFVMDFEHGAEVYQRDSIDWIDGDAPGRLVGTLCKQAGRAWALKPAKNRRFNVTIPTCEHVTDERAIMLTVKTPCELTAKREAERLFNMTADDRRGLHVSRHWYEVKAAPLHRNELLEMALTSVKRDTRIPVSQRIKIREAIREAQFADA